MSRTGKWLHAGLICLLAGLALCLTVAGLNGFDWAGLGTVYHYRSREYTIEKPFDEAVGLVLAAARALLARGMEAQ